MNISYAVVLSLFVIILIYLYWRFYFFFRDPGRNIPEGDNIVSPADGTIVYIRKVENNIVPISIKNKKEIKLDEILRFRNIDLKFPYWIIGIFMHPTDVHVNRAPISGIVEKIIYTKGSNLPMTMMWLRVLLKRKPYEFYSPHVFINERNTICIKGDFPLCITQIADIYVNRIESWVNEGDEIRKGQKIGIIKMGSQVDFIFPCKPNIEIIGKEGQRVKAGESIIATIK